MDITGASATNRCFIPAVHVLNLQRRRKHLYRRRGARWMFDSILCEVTEYDPEVLEPLIGLAVEIAREGREGRRIGTLFTLGDENAVLAKSRPLILDPLLGHPESSRHVTNLNLRGTIKELAQLDGGFVGSPQGIVVSESSLVRLFCHGQLVGEIIPEVWMMDHAHLRGTAKREQVGELTILTPSLRAA